MILISREQLHKLTNIAPKTITRRLADAAVEPVKRQGRSALYDSAVALRTILAPLTGTAGKLDLQEERAQLAKEQRRFYRLKNDAIDKKLVDLDLAVRHMEDAILATRQRLLHLPGRLAMQLDHQPAEVVARVTDDIVREVLDDFAEHVRGFEVEEPPLFEEAEDG